LDTSQNDKDLNTNEVQKEGISS